MHTGEMMEKKKKILLILNTLFIISSAYFGVENNLMEICFWRHLSNRIESIRSEANESWLRSKWSIEYVPQ